MGACVPGKPGDIHKEAKSSSFMVRNQVKNEEKSFFFFESVQFTMLRFKNMHTPNDMNFEPLFFPSKHKIQINVRC